tara:strand:+ start:1571 stop:2209 length:639 start_codon:yes stop_codon:yes gene_type:complete
MYKNTKYFTKTDEYINDLGQKVLRKTNFKRTQRRVIHKFGNALTDGNEGVTIRSPEDIHIMSINDYNKTTRNDISINNINSEQRWIPRHLREGFICEKEEVVPRESEKKYSSSNNSNAYKPPRHSNKLVSFSIKISNITEDLQPSDFEYIIKKELGLYPTRIKLMMSKTKETCLGFAFVDFRNKEDQQNAIKKIEGYIIGYQILSAEVAKSN